MTEWPGERESAISWLMVFISLPERSAKGAEEFDHNTIKKHEQLPLKLGMLDPIYFLMYSTNEKISITQIEGNFPQSAFPKREQREQFVKDWPQVPDEKFKQYLPGLGTTRR